MSLSSELYFVKKTFSSSMATGCSGVIYVFYSFCYLEHLSVYTRMYTCYLSAKGTGQKWLVGWLIQVEQEGLYPNQ